MGQKTWNYPARLWLLVLVAGLLVTGCAVELTGVNFTQTRLRSYEESLRSEADWLWNNMNYARMHFTPDPRWCTSYDFDHQPVSLSASEREDDPNAASLVDHLDYAAGRLAEVRTEWERYCQGRSGSPADYMEQRLRLAYNSLNTVHAAVQEEAAPERGST
jgi:hypothetical protein